MSIPESCTTLVVGGGPGGSYVASVLAREGVDVVLLEADIFPRYHIGESMLSSLRHFLRFIDLDERFDKHGFQKKLGAAFKLNENGEAFTDFVAANGPNGYAWNVVRSESDELMFRYAGECGAQIFDGIKINAVEFAPTFDNQEEFSADPKLGNPGRPVTATWTRKEDGSSGTIRFEYLVDASGRAGLMSTKYLKNRKFNEGLKNIANWGYWKGAGQYAVGTAKENQPFFEALTDASGWCWSIPLHNGTMSVGIVMRQDLLIAKKKELGPSTNSEQFYKESLKLAPGILKLLENAEFVSSGVKTASDYSYSANEYAGPYFRIVGDAGCFIDPYFSSGVHLALSSGLSAALTIQAARRGDCNEATAAKWHSNKVTEGYTRFLLVILTALKQIRKQDEPVLNDFDEEGFDTAFSFFRPIIQGNADSGATLTQGEVSKTIDFCLNAFHPVKPEERQAVQKKIEEALGGSKTENPQELSEKLTEDELRVLHSIRARRMLRTEDTLNLNNFRKDVICGFMPNVERGSLGLLKVSSQLPAENGDDAGLERPEPTDVFAIINLQSIVSKSEEHQGNN